MGGSSGGGSQVVNQGGLIDSPLNEFLIPQAGNMLTNAGRWSTLGSAPNLMPSQLLGQTYVPGPNQTIFGNPYNTAAQSANYWGAPAQPNYQQMYQQFLNPGQQGVGGGASGGSGSGGAQQNPTQQLIGKLQSLQQPQQGGQQQQNQPQQQQVAATQPPAQPVLNQDGIKVAPGENWVPNNGTV